VTYYGLSYTETGEGGNGRTQQLKRLAVLSLAEELNAMGDCDFSEWCRRSKSSGAAVPEPVCVRCCSPTTAVDITRQSGVGQPAELRGNYCTAACLGVRGGSSQFVTVTQ
jgi:hypothetical protein